MAGRRQVAELEVPELLRLSRAAASQRFQPRRFSNSIAAAGALSVATVASATATWSQGAQGRAASSDGPTELTREASGVPLIMIPVSAISAGLNGIHSPVVQDRADHCNLILSESFANRPQLILASGIRANHHDDAIR